MALFILGILALILLMGNAYLYFFPLKRKLESFGFENPHAFEWEDSVQSVQEKNLELEKRLSLHEDSAVKKFKVLNASISNVNAKAEDAIRRIGRLESSVALGEFRGKTNSLLEKKIERLEDFRRNATIELEAIKELIPELKEKKKASVFSSELEEKIHNLVFHGKARK